MFLSIPLNCISGFVEFVSVDTSLTTSKRSFFSQFQWNQGTCDRPENTYEPFSASTLIIRESSSSRQYNPPVLTPCFDLILAGRNLSKVGIAFNHINTSYFENAQLSPQSLASFISLLFYLSLWLEYHKKSVFPRIIVILSNCQVQMDYFSNASGDSDEDDIVFSSGIWGLSRYGGIKRSNLFESEQLPKRRQISKNNTSESVGKTFDYVMVFYYCNLFWQSAIVKFPLKLGQSMNQQMSFASDNEFWCVCYLIASDQKRKLFIFSEDAISQKMTKTA